MPLRLVARALYLETAAHCEPFSGPGCASWCQLCLRECLFIFLAGASLLVWRLRIVEVYIFIGTPPLPKGREATSSELRAEFYRCTE